MAATASLVATSTYQDFFGLVEGLNIGAGFTHVWGSDSLDKLISWAGLGYDDNLLNAYATYALGVNSA